MSEKFEAITTEIKKLRRELEDLAEELQIGDIKYGQGYNAGYSKEEELATVIATNLLIKLGIFDRVTLWYRQVVAEKYMIGENYGRFTLCLSMQYPGDQGYDPYVMKQQWFFSIGADPGTLVQALRPPVALEFLLSQLDKQDARLLLFNLDILTSSEIDLKEIDLKEYNKNGLKYS